MLCNCAEGLQFSAFHFSHHFLTVLVLQLRRLCIVTFAIMIAGMVLARLEIHSATCAVTPPISS